MNHENKCWYPHDAAQMCPDWCCTGQALYLLHILDVMVSTGGGEEDAAFGSHMTTMEASVWS